MTGKGKTKSAKYRTCPFCQKAPPSARPALSPMSCDRSLPQKPEGPPAAGGLSWAQP